MRHQIIKLELPGHERQRNRKGGFTQSPVTVYEPVHGQRQSSHMLRWPYSAEFSQFRTAYGLLKPV